MRFHLITFVVAILVVNTLGIKPCVNRPECEGVPTDETDGEHADLHDNIG